MTDCSHVTVVYLLVMGKLIKYVISDQKIFTNVGIRACQQSISGAENAAERAENRVSGSGEVRGHSKKTLERERSVKRAKSAAQCPITLNIKGNRCLLTFRRFSDISS